MPIQTISATLGERRLAGASTGVSLSTTAAITSLIPGTQFIALTPRDFVTAVVLRYSLNPYLVVLHTSDGLATDPLDVSYRLQDGDNTLTFVLNSFDTLANGDAIYVGSHVPFRGVAVDVQNANGNASTLTVRYWDGETWTDISATDGTASGGATFAVDGNVTWTVPTRWAAARLRDITSTTYAKAHFKDHLFWTRWTTSAAFDSATSVNQMRALNRSTAYQENISGQTIEESVKWGYMGHATLEALVDAGTGKVLVQCFTKEGNKFLPVAS